MFEYVHLDPTHVHYPAMQHGVDILLRRFVPDDTNDVSSMCLLHGDQLIDLQIAENPYVNDGLCDF